MLQLEEYPVQTAHLLPAREIIVLSCPREDRVARFLRRRTRSVLNSRLLKISETVRAFLGPNKNKILKPKLQVFSKILLVKSGKYEWVDD